MPTTALTAAGKKALAQIGEGAWSSALTITPAMLQKLVDGGHVAVGAGNDDNPWIEPVKAEAEAPAAEPVFDAKAAREELEAKAAKEIAAAKEEGDGLDGMREVLSVPVGKAKKAKTPIKAAPIVQPKKSVTGDKAPAKGASKAPAKKAAPAPEKAAPVDPHTVPDSVAVTSIPADSELKWRNKARETKTVVGIYDGAASVTEESPLRWVLHCEAHDAINRYRTYKEAWLESAHPMAFCPSCSVL